MGSATEFYDNTFHQLLEHNPDVNSVAQDAKYALGQRERDIYDSETELEDFADYIRERYKNIIAKKFISPFGYCVMLVEKGVVKEFTDWLKTRGYDDQQP